jgi:phospholipid/cholesterol/gamma-HCH transport system permease protein
VSASRPCIEQRVTDGGVCATLHGPWAARALSRKSTWQATQAELKRIPLAAAWDLTAIDTLDHLGALALWIHWGRQWPRQVAMDDEQRAILERVASQRPEPAQRARNGIAESIETLGEGVLLGLRGFRDFLALIGQLLLDLTRLIALPQRWPWRDFSGNLFRIGAQALTSTALVGFLIGVVLAYLMGQVLRQFGASAFIVNILGLALIRELGPLLAAVLVAGRSGSAITAQIGVMRVTEELDAMRVLGIPISLRLVLPRTLALMIAMPLIAVWTSAAALVGGALASSLTLGITPSFFMDALPKVVPLANLVLAVGKSVTFGLFIALIACHFGLRVKPNTVSLGEGTTASVVTSITVVILLDALFAILFKSVGMGS